jgi:hypothetical protein
MPLFNAEWSYDELNEMVELVQSQPFKNIKKAVLLSGKNLPWFTYEAVQIAERTLTYLNGPELNKLCCVLVELNEKNKEPVNVKPS